jgi:ABC-2 type transport system permease protein
VSAREAATLVARREITEGFRSKSFLVSTVVSLAIVVVAVVLIALIGGDGTRYVVGYTDQRGAAVADAAAGAAAGDVELEARSVDPAAARAGLDDGSLDAVVSGDEIRSQEDPEDDLVALLQAANRQVRAAGALEQAGVSEAEAREVLSPPPLQVRTVEPVDEDEDEKAGLTFFIVIMLYGQLITFGYWVAAGVVEEKASRVVEVVLATLRPAHLLAGKVIGIGLLGLANMVLVGVTGLLTAVATGALDLDGDVLSAILTALVWFVIGYAFYACAFACAGAIVPRQEELQSSMTPLSIMLLISFFLAFAVLDDPDGTIARISAFVPMTAPITMPPRIVLGDATTIEIVASFVVTIAATAALIPLAGRIYAGGVLRTGSALKLREAWRAARA